MNTYVITGATGNTGRRIALGLLGQGHRVRVVSRNAEKARGLVERGGEIFEGETTDANLLARAFAGADAVYVMIPMDAGAPDYTAMQVTHSAAMAEALRAASVKHAVTLSSVGTHLSEDSGVVLGLRRMEQMLDSVDGLSVLHLRPTYFMENTLAMAGPAKHSGIFGSPIRPDIAIPMIATQDIADAALRRLQALDFSGKSHLYLLGPRDVTFAEVAQVYGAAIGRPGLPYVQFPYDDAREAMIGMGMGRSVVDKLIEFVKLLNAGRVHEDARRTAETTTPTTIEEFSNTFKAVYERT